MVAPVQIRISRGERRGEREQTRVVEGTRTGPASGRVGDVAPGIGCGRMGCGRGDDDE